jgi:hypothetical protein
VAKKMISQAEMERAATAMLHQPTPSDGGEFDADQASEIVLLASYRRAIEAGDQAEIDRLAARLLFPVAAVRLHKTILQEAAELRPLADQVDQTAAAVVEIERELKLLERVQIRNLDEFKEVGRIRAELETKAKAARLAMNESAAARVSLDFLEAWAGPLFGRPAAKFPCLCDGMKTAEIAEELGADDWRGPRVAAGGQAKPRRRIVAM